MGHGVSRRGSAIRWLVALGFTVVLGACDQEAGPGGDAGFSFVRLDDQGQPVGAGADDWRCVLDERTGLVWEVKSDRPGLHFRENTYTWYEPDSKTDPLDYRGIPDGGSCEGSPCDTASFVDAVNASGLCGFRDWRMPYRQELRSINDPRRPIAPPTLATEYFPNAQSGEYWTGNGYRMQHDAAWAWGFDTSLDRVDWKRNPKYVRLVRGTHADIARLTDKGDN